MSSQSTSTITTLPGKKIAMTNVDSWFGYSAAYHLAQELEKKCHGVTLVCLACKTEHLEKLKQFKNVRLEKVDYKDPHILEKAFHGVCCTILIPEMDERRAELGKNVLHAMNKQGVKSCMMISCDGASEDCQLKSMKSYCELEKRVQESCASCYLIFRKSFLNQCFLFWSSVVKSKAEFPMTVEKDSTMSPIDACDLICAINAIVVQKCQHTDDGDEDDETGGFGIHKNKTYTLTGPHELTPERLVRELSEAIGQEIKFRHVEREELKKYLESLLQRKILSLEVLSEDVPVYFSGDGDHDYDRHGHLPTNEAMIELILDEFELFKKGKAGFASNDLEKILGRQGKSIKDFLRKEKDAFKPHRD
ncbi:hypothetical protein BGX28_007672 [Mortierella sp. GBA30]|nr:hypothetical protein BGX28_007672 [Mortierella sp. GBA30]